jgi:competence protein ComEC
VGHHGSRTSTTQEFLDAVAPSVAVISAGFQNSFGHPHADVLDRLAARGVTLLRTDTGGLATVRTDGRRLWLDTMLWNPQGLAAQRGLAWAQNRVTVIP